MTFTRTRVVEGMRLVVEDREQRVRHVLGQSEYVLKCNVHSSREATDLANAAEKHAGHILAAVAEYRAALVEMTAVASAELQKISEAAANG